MKQIFIFLLLFSTAMQAMEQSKEPSEEEVLEDCKKAIESLSPEKLRKTLQKSHTKILNNEMRIPPESSSSSIPSSESDEVNQNNQVINFETLANIAKSSSILGVEKYKILIQQVKHNIDHLNEINDSSCRERIAKQLKKIKDPGKLGFVILSSSAYKMIKTFMAPDGAIDTWDEVIALANGLLTGGVGAYQIYSEYFTKKNTQDKLDKALAMLYILQENLAKKEQESEPSNEIQFSEENISSS